MRTCRFPRWLKAMLLAVKLKCVIRRIYADDTDDTLRSNALPRNH